MVASLVLWEAVIAKHAERSAIEFLDGEQWTYGQLWANAQQFANDLRARHGLVPGDAVLVQYRGARQALLHLFGAMHGGWRVCPISSTAPSRYIQAASDLVRPKLSLLNDAVVHEPSNRDVAEHLGGFLIALSSGSTGQPKAIQHSLQHYLASAVAFGNLSQFGTHTRLYHVLPWVYMAGILNACLAVLSCGGTVIEGEPFQAMGGATLALSALRRSANTLSLVPTMASSMVFLTRNADVLKQFPLQIQQVQCTSAPIPKGLREQFLAKFQAPLRDCYGITEVGGPVSLQTEEDARAMNDFSVPAEAYTIGLAARDDNEGSELMVGSPFSMMGYLEAGSLAASVAQPFPTGDLAESEFGRIRIIGRIKDLIIRGGYNISPQYVESVVSQCAGVRESAVVGYDAGLAGERMALFVSLWDDTAAARSALQLYLAAELQSVEQADKVIVLAELPRLYNGKLDKPSLRAMINV
ncbi:class I adenylate-forming enzyme family protein [Curvibacter sp. APW13]|uniref:class I adenylate-forming enzyme family protein n=1 Tax=Curvibacter sp. APW13 TaxID=3077236 RepID=UPI0028DEBFD5|nr:class I adenylate-forming enzyme family protein [Curvibacter sp. APW13]MDT8993015.1 class I adenylate-forming enzyme family protein [Curvibacter sp. APW13]